MAWVAWIILAREFAVTGLRAIAAVDGVVISASPLGKIKTVAQIIAISAIFTARLASFLNWASILVNLFYTLPCFLRLSQDLII